MQFIKLSKCTLLLRTCFFLLLICLCFKHLIFSSINLYTVSSQSLSTRLSTLASLAHFFAHVIVLFCWIRRYLHTLCCNNRPTYSQLHTVNVSVFIYTLYALCHQTMDLLVREESLSHKFVVLNFCSIHCFSTSVFCVFIDQIMK